MRLAGIVLLSGLVAASVVMADGPVQTRLASTTAGMSSGESIVYSIDATEWGADPTGQTDCSEPLQQALNELKKRQGGTLFLPAGRYRLDKSINIEGGVSLRGEWMHPDRGGLGRGTIFCVYGGKGDTNLVKGAAVKVRSGASLRGVTFWHPEQSAERPVPYPASVYGDGHTSVSEVTFIDSWYGFYNSHCSSMIVRDLYGTCLSGGIFGAYAFDIPRIEHVCFDSKYWLQSKLPGAPKGLAAARLNTYLEKNFIGVSAGEQDWGYWWDIRVNHAKWGIYLAAFPSDDGKKMVPGNIAAGLVRMANVEVGCYLENVGYPGFQLTYGEIHARKCGVLCPPKPDYSAYQERGVKPAYYENATIVFSGLTFVGGESSVRAEKKGRYNLNFKDCVFRNASSCAVDQLEGSLTVTSCRFEGRAPCCKLGQDADQAVLSGNVWGRATPVAGWAADDPRIFRDDKLTTIPKTPQFTFSGVLPPAQPAVQKLFDVTAFGAKPGTVDALPTDDSTAAIQQALDAARTARGGVVYVPAGVYRVTGALRVPTGVTLQGSFIGQHYGNSTRAGTQLYAYGGKDRPKGMPLITLARGSACKGFSVFYPEQGVTDKSTEERLRVKQYPPTIRTASECRVENMSIVGAWCAVDAKTVKSDNLVVSDVTGAAMDTCLDIGHGSVGGVVRDFHFNYSGWGQQGLYRANFKGVDYGEWDHMLTDYTTRKVKGLVLGDAKKVTFFSCFNILVAEQIVLEKDQYTGGDFDGIMWGVAFDAAGQGIVGRAGSAGRIAIVASMGVFNQQGGGYYFKTDPAFKGVAALFNADVWSGHSFLADVRGGKAYFVQLFSWCCGKGGCYDNGKLGVLASVMVSNNNDNHTGDMVDFTFGPGSSGTVAGSCDCRKMLHLVIEDGADVTLSNNGFMRGK